MACLLLRNLVKSSWPPPLRILASLRNPSLPSPPPAPSLLHHRLPVPNPFPDPNPNPSSVAGVPIFPSFPHWFHLERFCVSGFDGAHGGEGGEVDGGSDRILWADSVKKKRKKKMNKHKYRKLRKRLRRQT